MFNEVTSNSVLSARVKDRTNELNTSNSRDNGADHGTGCEKKKLKKNCAINFSSAILVEATSPPKKSQYVDEP